MTENHQKASAQQQQQLQKPGLEMKLMSEKCATVVSFCQLLIKLKSFYEEVMFPQHVHKSICLGVCGWVVVVV